MNWITEIFQKIVRTPKPPKRPPEYIRGEMATALEREYPNYWANASEEEKNRLILTFTSFVTNLNLLSNLIISLPFLVGKASDSEPVVDKNHYISRLFAYPNPYFTFSQLVTHLIKSAALSRYGGFWYLAPSVNDKNVIAEIWPIIPNRIKPVKSASEFISHFIYNPLGSNKTYKIDPKYILWHRDVNLYDLAANEPLSNSLINELQIQDGINATQKKNLVESSGVPRAIVSLDPNLGNDDYINARDDIINDWASGSTPIAVTRGGAIDVKVLGLSEKDLQTIASDQNIGNKISASFWGIDLSEADPDEIMKWIKEAAVKPQSKKLVESMNLSLILRFNRRSKYRIFIPKATIQDRALAIQEFSAKSHMYTLKEARMKDNLPPLKGKYEYLNEMPYKLLQPSFVADLIGFQSNAGHEEGDPEVGNINESISPEREVDNQINASVSKIAFNKEVSDAAKVFKKDSSREFESCILTDKEIEKVKLLVSNNMHVKDIKEIMSREDFQ